MAGKVERRILWWVEHPRHTVAIVVAPNLPYNCTICGLDFYGPLLIVGVDGENFCDLPDAWSDPLMRSWMQLHEDKA